jgi:hypothetical protein
MTEHYRVAVDRLNGREKPNGKIRTVRNRDDAITGSESGGWVTADDGLFYKLEFLTLDDAGEAGDVAQNDDDHVGPGDAENDHPPEDQGR